jgi:thiamine-monophosphate kinase
MTKEIRVQDIGEQGLLQRLQSFCPPDLIGDDAALLSIAAGHSLVVTTDTLVDGVHFSDRTTSPADVGWRAVAANLSDLAAMGAEPIALTVGLSLPGSVTVNWVEQLYQGMIDGLQPFQTPIVGGDICRSSVISLAITALGQVRPAEAIRRSIAQPGDAILITGYHGASRAGLELLLNSELGNALEKTAFDRLVQAHQRPIPRLDVVTLLTDLRTQYPDLRVAGMDSSDGLADAIVQICRASRVGATVKRDQIPVPPEFTPWVSNAQAIEWMLYGGEDFELVLCLPVEIAEKLLVQLGDGAAIVGKITAEQTVSLQNKDAIVELSLNRGFQHFSVR